VEYFWLWLDTPKSPPFESEGELRLALEVFEHDDIGSLAYIDTAEAEYILSDAR
jgi:hypothetical protein